jgi:hypothetical protein
MWGVSDELLEPGVPLEEEVPLFPGAAVPFPTVEVFVPVPPAARLPLLVGEETGGLQGHLVQVLGLHLQRLDPGPDIGPESDPESDPESRTLCGQVTPWDRMISSQPSRGVQMMRSTGVP